jgi:hypothetical protein
MTVSNDKETCLETTIQVPTAWASKSVEACCGSLRNLLEDVELSLYKELRSLNPKLPICSRQIEEPPYRDDAVPYSRMYALVRCLDDLEELGFCVIEDRPDDDRWKVSIGKSEDDQDPITVWGYDHASAFGMALMSVVSRSHRMVVLAN